MFLQHSDFVSPAHPDRERAKKSVANANDAAMIRRKTESYTNNAHLMWVCAEQCREK